MAVRFRAIDGVRLAGRLFGRGPTGVVLSHMGNPGNSQSDWWSVADLLANRGYVVLTYDRRGVCPGGLEGCSRGADNTIDAWKGVLGAVRFMRSRGADTVVAGGASLGAMTTIYAAARGRIDGLIAVAPVDFYGGISLTDLVRSIDGPMLFVTGRFDGEPAHATRALYRRARGPKVLVLLDTDEHGTDILTYGAPDAARQLRVEMVSFLEGIS